MDKTNNIDREYEYKGLCINGFLMIFFTFILIPALMVLAIISGGEDNPGISVGLTLPLHHFRAWLRRIFHTGA